LPAPMAWAAAKAERETAMTTDFIRREVKRVD
jgi:hypothetical protein